ncbi:MAG: DUF5702 domain-containing protein [Candidatus Gastranaerophilales bacterium]|nr:DUF5702 domain-containing protein [Candidatus Gastranaerophilales bacterium]
MSFDRRKDPAYLTVYLALTLSVLISLCLALIEGARSNGIRLETECVADIGLNSIFAEYHRELLEQYNLFAIDSSYGSGYAASENVTQHLRQYLERNLSMEDVFLSDFIYRDFFAMSVSDVNLTRALILTDDGGAVFRRRAAAAVWSDVGLSLLGELQQWMQVVDANDLTSRDVEAEKAAVDQEIQQLLEYAENEEISKTEEIGKAEETGKTEESGKTEETGGTEETKETEEIGETRGSIDNPTDYLEEVRQEGILKWVIEDPQTLSGRSIVQDNLAASRMEQGILNQGNFTLEELSPEETFLERFVFQEYLLQYMGRYGQEDEENALLYQIEYLVAGESSDLENLRSVANRLCLLREVANTVYILSDEMKCMEAELLATILSAIVQLPELMEPLKLAILLGWAYAESLYDVETLLAGGRVPLMKDEDTWHYSLQGALSASDKGDGREGEGLSYEDYLRIFMTLTELDVLTGRAMNLVEADIRQTAGNEAFRLDGCYDRVEACIQIKSAYGYEYSITRQRSY